MLQVILALLGAAPQLLPLLLQIFNEVHTVQAAMPGAPGADKSQHVIDKVTPIAQVLGAEIPHVQDLVNQVVGVSKQLKIGAFGTNATDNAGG
jgi:hypothetical protein